MTSPFTTGLRQYIHNRFDTVVSKSLQTSCQRLFHSPPAPSNAKLNRLSEIGEASTSILFSTAGTGKTRLLLDLLSESLGMYIMAPGVPVRPAGSEAATVGVSTLLRPVRGNASRDTLSLWESLDKATFKIEVLDARELGATIVYARTMVFDTFTKHFPEYSNPDPITCQVWMQLQVNCIPHFDPFDLAWRFARLDLETSKTYAESWISSDDDDFIWCIDEAQVALETRIGEELLECIWTQSLNTVRRLRSKVILSGTALQLKEVRRVIEKMAQPYEVNAQNTESDLWMMYSTMPILRKIDSFPLFWDLYQRHMQDILLENKAIQRNPALQSVAECPLKTCAGRPLGFGLNFSNLPALDPLLQINDSQNQSQLPAPPGDLSRIRTAINNHCPKFFGRYRWSTLFIEQILYQAVISIQRDGSLAQLSVEDAAKEAAGAVEKALQTQLSRVKGKAWVERLYWMAIRADVYSQSSIIDDKSAMMVSEGFALVEKLRYDTSNIPGSNV